MPYFKGDQSEYVVHYAGGKVRREGRAQSFWYLRLNTTISLVPMNAQDVPFVFNEITSDHQAVTYQGMATFRITTPQRALETLNLSVDPRTKTPQSSDLDQLRQRITNTINSAASSEIQSRTLIATLRDFEAMSASILLRLGENATLATYGVEVVNLVITSIRPTPEVAKAMEAELRESLMKAADEAIYARRKAAVEEERKIKEQEMATELAVEHKRKEIIALSSENLIAEADARGQAAAAQASYELDRLAKELAIWQKVDASKVAALGFKSLGDKGAEQVVITTEVLASLMSATKPR